MSRTNLSSPNLAVCCKHAVGVCDDGDKTGGVDDGTSGPVVGGDIREVQLAVCCKHAVVNVFFLHDFLGFGLSSTMVVVNKV